MLSVDTVLCPVDFSPITHRTLELGIEVCRLFDAGLIVLHDIETAPGPGMGVGWMWTEEHLATEERRKVETDTRLRELLATLPEEIAAIGMVSHGYFDEVLPAILRDNHVDMVVMGTHGVDTEEHRSRTASFVTFSPAPVLVLRDRGPDTSVFTTDWATENPVNILVPLDFADYSLTAAAYAFELARLVPMRVHLLHVEPPTHHLLRRPPQDKDLESRRRRSAELLGTLIPASLRERTTIHTATGRVGLEIVAHAAEVEAAMIVMGVHEKGFLKRWTEGVPSSDALFGSPCPVLFISAIAARSLSQGALAG